MFALLERIRKKPRHIKDRYAFYGAALITAFIAVIWVISLPATYKTAGVTQLDTDSESRPAFSTFFKEAKDQLANLKEGISEIVATSTATSSMPAATSTTTLPTSLEDVINGAATGAIIAPSSTAPAVRTVQIGTTSATNSPAAGE